MVSILKWRPPPGGDRFRHGGTSTYALHDQLGSGRLVGFGLNNSYFKPLNANDTVAVANDAAFEAAVEDLVVADAMANFDAEAEAFFADASVAV